MKYTGHLLVYVATIGIILLALAFTLVGFGFVKGFDIGHDSGYTAGYYMGQLKVKAETGLMVATWELENIDKDVSADAEEIINRLMDDLIMPSPLLPITYDDGIFAFLEWSGIARLAYLIDSIGKK